MALVRRGSALLGLAQPQSTAIRLATHTRRNFRWSPGLSNSATPDAVLQSASSRPTADTVVDESNINETPLPESSIPRKEGYLFVDSMFPIRLAQWECVCRSHLSLEYTSDVTSCSLRHYLGLLREDQLTNKLREVLSSVRTRGFKVVSIDKHAKACLRIDACFS
jgi:hypothetical protein